MSASQRATALFWGLNVPSPVDGIDQKQRLPLERSLRLPEVSSLPYTSAMAANLGEIESGIISWYKVY